MSRAAEEHARPSQSFDKKKKKRPRTNRAKARLQGRKERATGGGELREASFVQNCQDYHRWSYSNQREKNRKNKKFDGT